MKPSFYASTTAPVTVSFRKKANVDAEDLSGNVDELLTNLTEQEKDKTTRNRAYGAKKVQDALKRYRDNNATAASFGRYPDGTFRNPTQ